MGLVTGRLGQFKAVSKLKMSVKHIFVKQLPACIHKFFFTSCCWIHSSINCFPFPLLCTVGVQCSAVHQVNECLDNWSSVGRIWQCRCLQENMNIFNQQITMSGVEDRPLSVPFLFCTSGILTDKLAVQFTMWMLRQPKLSWKKKTLQYL